MKLLTEFIMKGEIVCLKLENVSSDICRNCLLYTWTASARRRTQRKVYGLLLAGHNCMAFRDMPKACRGEALAERYEITTFRFCKIAQDRYYIKVQWKC